MKIYEGKVPKTTLDLFVSDIGSGDFFGYVGNLVSIEQAIAVLGLLSPDFIEREGHIFWKPNAIKYTPEKFPLQGFCVNGKGTLEPSSIRRDVERYRNNFAVSQFFHKWEDAPDRAVFRVGLSKEDYELCHIFAKQIMKYWKLSLSSIFPKYNFEFEIADNLLDEYGVCITFWQI